MPSLYAYPALPGGRGGGGPLTCPQTLTPSQPGDRATVQVRQSVDCYVYDDPPFRNRR
jgi:hypothetical protein